MTAEHVLLFRFLGASARRRPRRGAIAHILHHQRERRLVGALLRRPRRSRARRSKPTSRSKCSASTPERAEMRKALRVIHRGGGVVNARVFTKIWLALFGIYPWRGVPSLPPELVYFPLWMPFNLYDFACWARGTVAPLTIVVSKKPVRALGVDVRRNHLARHRGGAQASCAATRLADGRRQGCRNSTNVCPNNRSATTRDAASPIGSSSAKRPTAAGAGFSRPGCTR